MANRKISDLTALTAPATGDLLPIVDISEAAAADKNKKITYGELLASAPDGSAAAPSFSFDSDPNTGIYSPGADQLAISTGGTGRLFIDASGLVGIGTSTFSYLANKLVIDKGSTGNDGITIVSSNTSNACIWFADGTTGSEPYRGGIDYNHSTDKMQIYTGAQGNITIDSSGRLGIGTTSPGATLDVVGSADTFVLSSNATNSTTKEAKIQCRHYTNAEENLMLLYGFSTSTNNVVALGGGSGNQNAATFVSFYTAADTTTTSGSERARIDSSGRLLVGTSSARSYASYGTAGIQNEATGFQRASLGLTNNENSADGVAIMLGKTRGTSIGSNTIVSSGDVLGTIKYQGADGTALRVAAEIDGVVDGTPGANDMPGRLVFSVTADGASSPSERMRIGSDGQASTFSSGNLALVVSSANAAGTTDYTIQARYGASSNTGGTTSFQVFTNGNTQNTNNSYGAISDVKLKENIVDAGSQWDDLKALQVRKYNFKEGQTHTQIGLVAQEVELVSPGLVTESPDRDAEGNDLGTVTKSVNYSVLYMKAVKALQEAMERIETLEQRLTDAGIE